jgi:ribosome-associated toxin RatA of RatAB toxin-antitoxin module
MRIVQQIDIDASADEVWRTVGREFTEIGRWASGMVLLVGAPWLERAVGVSRWFLGATGAGLLAFAVAASQWAGLRRAGTGPLDGTSPFMVQVQRDVIAPVGAVWDAVSDAAAYARFAPGIATTAVSGRGDDMVRVCTDTHGSQWSETCTLWEPGRRYRMSVDVRSYPLRYRMLFSELHQTWDVEPSTRGSRVTLAFHGAVKLGVLGRLVVRAMARRLDGILDAYEVEVTTQPA